MKQGQSQFLSTPRTNRRNLREKQRLSEDIKVKYIKELEDRNRKLKVQILKINEMLEEQKEKPAVKKQHKLVPHEPSSDVIKKQLQNVYKQIKNYEKQINTLETKQAGGMITDRLSRLQNILKEKTTHLDKLKGQLSALTKTSLDNMKKLKNNAGKEELENSMLKFNAQIKVLRDKVRDAENWEKKKSENAKKQYDYVKKLERELIENGMAVDEIQEMKKNNIYNHIYDKLKHQKSDDEEEDQPKNSKSKVKQVEEVIEQLTIDRYEQLKNEVRLYKKLQKDYEKRLQVVEKERKNQEAQTVAAKQKLEEKQHEVRGLQDQVSDLKSRVKRKSPKPYNVTKEEEKPKQKPKMPSTRKKQKAANIKSITDQTHIKYDEKGQATTKGERFTDRTLIGKTTELKIIGVKVWTEKNTFSINGIQCTYKVGQITKAGQECLNKNGKKYCSENIMELQNGDYIKTISGHLSQGNVIEYLVFISKNNVIGRFGMAKQTQKQFNYDIDDDEIPICMYGSIMNTKQNKKEGSLIENLGFQICRDKAFQKDDKYI